MKELYLPRNIKKITDDFIKGLRNVYGEGLVSVILYGSAASGEYAKKHSNINLAIILNDTSLASLAKISKLVNKNKFLIINPIFFTEDYINRSADVFPIEFLDIKENNAVVYGKDVFKDLKIDIKNLRFQCEQELKSKILNIKRLYLKTRNRSILRKILFKSLTSSLHILRNLVRLKGKEPSYAKEDVLSEVAAAFGVDVSSLDRILDAKNMNTRLSPQEIGSLFVHLVETLEDIGDKVDHL